VRVGCEVIKNQGGAAPSTLFITSYPTLDYAHTSSSDEKPKKTSAERERAHHRMREWNNCVIKFSTSVIVYLFIYLFICLFTYLFIYLFLFFAIVLDKPIICLICNTCEWNNCIIYSEFIKLSTSVVVSEFFCHIFGQNFCFAAKTLNAVAPGAIIGDGDRN